MSRSQDILNYIYTQEKKKQHKIRLNRHQNIDAFLVNIAVVSQNIFFFFYL